MNDLRYLFCRNHETIECHVSTLMDGSFRVVIRYPDQRAEALSFNAAHLMNQHWKRFVRRLREERWVGPSIAL